MLYSSTQMKERHWVLRSTESKEWIVIMGTQVKIELFKNSLEKKDFTYFPNLIHFSLNSKHSISDEDIKIFTNYLQKLRDDFRIRFDDIERMTVPAELVTPFDVNFENSKMKPELEQEISEINIDIAVKSIFENRNFEPVQIS